MRLELKDAVRYTHYLVGHAKVVLHQMERVAWEEVSHPGYSHYGWDDNQLLDYHAYESCSAQLASFCPGFNAMGPATMEPVILRAAQRDFGRSTPPSVETVFDCRDGNTPWAVALSAGHLPLLSTHCATLVAVVSYRAYASGQSAPSWVQVPTRPLLSQSHRTPADAPTHCQRSSLVRVDISKDVELRATSETALSELTSSTSKLHSVSPTQTLLLSERWTSITLMRDLRSACFVFNCCKCRMVLDLTEMPLGWFRELLGQKIAL